jgi:predicted acylesterase/phospholipase RssA
MVNQNNNRRPIKVQVAFQGGGAKIFALIAAAKALQELEQEGEIIVTRVAGSSAGSIVASMYAMEIVSDTMRTHFKDLPVEYEDIKKNKINKIYSEFNKFSQRNAIGKCIALKRIRKMLPFEKPLVEESIVRKILERIPEFTNKKIKEIPNKKLIITKSDIANRENVSSPIDNRIIDEILHSCRIPFFFGNESIQADFFDGGLTNNLATNFLIDEADEFGTVIAVCFKNEKRNDTSGLFKKIESIVFSAIDSSVNLNLNRKRLFPIFVKDFGVNMIDFEKMSNILSGNDNRPFDENYNEAIKTLRNDFLENNFARKESIKSRLFQINSNLPRIKESQISLDVKIQYPYTNLQGVTKMQEDVNEYLNDNKLWTSEPFNPSDKEKYFDALQRPEIAILNNAIYLFPFLLSRMRRNYWGVIDYGSHRSLGIILTNDCCLKTSQNNHSLKNNLKKHHKFEISNPIPNNEMKRGNHWIDDLIDSIDKNQGELITIAGYLYNELIPLMILDSENPYALNKLSDISKVIYPHDIGLLPMEDENHIKVYATKFKMLQNGMDLVEENQFRLHYKMLKEFNKQKRKSYSAIIYDLTYSYIIDFLIKEMNISAEIIKVHHYLDIMVGIGFSLPSFERLEASDKHWNNIKQIALKSLKRENENLLNIGIQLDLSNLKQE